MTTNNVECQRRMSMFVLRSNVNGGCQYRMLLLTANVECQYGATKMGCMCSDSGYMWLYRGCIWPHRCCILHISCQIAEDVCPQAYVWLHVAVHGRCPGISYGCTKAACDCLCGYILLLRTAFGRGRATFSCKGSSYGSHATDLPYMLHLAGPGWAARIPGNCPGRGIWAVLGPLIHQTG